MAPKTIPMVMSILKTARSCASTPPWEGGAVLDNGRQPEWSPVCLTDICTVILSTISDGSLKNDCISKEFDVSISTEIIRGFLCS